MSRRMIPQYDTKLFTDIWDTAGEFLQDYQQVGIPTTISNASATTLYYLLYAKYANNPIANYDENQFKYKVFSLVFQYGPTWEKRLSIQQTLRGLQLEDLIDDGRVSEVYEHDGTSGSTRSGTNGNTRTLNTQEANTGTVKIETDNEVEDIKNHAFNPGTAPATNAYSPLNYINQQDANKNTLDGDQTTTNNLNRADTGTITDAGTDSATISNTDSADDTRNRTLTVGKLIAYERLLSLLNSDVTGDFINKFKICFKQFVTPERTWIYVTSDDEEDDE